MDPLTPSDTSQLPADQSPTAGPSGGSLWIPYSTTKHRVTKGRYITSNDPRGYIPVYEYPLNNQWVMMDVDDGYVLWTGIWKALGNAKADIVKMIESQPELESQLRRVRGGYLKIQGTWMPYEVALRLARRVAWPIRHDLVPLFGPTFPSTCLSPDQPGYGQVLDNAGRRRKRGPNAAARAAAAAMRNQQHMHPGSLSQIRHHPPYGEYRHHTYAPPPGYYGGYPAGPGGPPPDEYGQYPPPHHEIRAQPPYAYEGSPVGYGTSYGPPPSHPADPYGYPPVGYPGGPPPPPPPGAGPNRGGYGPLPSPVGGEYSFPPRGDLTPGFGRRGPGDSRTRYTPYPVPISPEQSHGYPPIPPPGPYASSSGPAGPSSARPASSSSGELAPISSIALGPPRERDGSGRPPGSSGNGIGRAPMLDRSLPPIESMVREGAGMPPSMDTAAVLRSLRREENASQASPTTPGAGGSAFGGELAVGEVPPRSTFTPLGIVRRQSGGPSDQYLMTRRRSASAPPPALLQSMASGEFSGPSAPGMTRAPSGGERDYDRDRAAYSRRGERLAGYSNSDGLPIGGTPGRYQHGYSRSGNEQFAAGASNVGPARHNYSRQHEHHHHPYASGVAPTSRPSSSSSRWTTPHSSSYDQHADEPPISPASSAPPTNPHAQNMHAYYTAMRSPPRSPSYGGPGGPHGADQSLVQDRRASAPETGAGGPIRGFPPSRNSAFATIDNENQTGPSPMMMDVRRPLHDDTEYMDEEDGRDPRLRGYLRSGEGGAPSESGDVLGSRSGPNARLVSNSSSNGRVSLLIDNTGAGGASGGSSSTDTPRGVRGSDSSGLDALAQVAASVSASASASASAASGSPAGSPRQSLKSPVPARSPSSAMAGAARGGDTEEEHRSPLRTW